MSEEYLNNFKPENEENSEPVETQASDTSPEYTEPVSTEPEFTQPVSDEPEFTSPETAVPEYSAPEPEVNQSYEDVYSNSNDYAGAQQSGYTNPYASADHNQNSAQPFNYSNPYYNNAPDAQAPQTGPSYNDGYYHKSFSGDTSGNNYNYTAPRYAQPIQSQQPAQSHTPPQRPQKKEKRGLSKGGIAILLVVCVLISGLAGFGGSMIASQINKSKYDSTTSDTMIIHKVDTEAQTATSGELVDKTTSEIATEVADSVVEITTEVMQTNSYYGQYIAQGAGSGVIISEDGYIITNNHVIDGASSIKVTTRDGNSYDAKLIGTDSEVDIAVLKIEATGLKTAVFGDSDKLTVGSKAVIIGNPLGTLGGSVSEGIISALDRSIVIDNKTMHLMQTDAAINPGNSGGGMFNGQGELAGIVVAKSSSSSESIDNIGFVIPINTVLDILGDLKDYGYVRGRAATGMSFIDLSNQMYAWYYYGNSSSGVYISSVESGSNAEKAGFRQGDRVVSVDGQEIKAASDIDNILKDKSVGDKITFELERSGSKGSIDLTLEEYVPTSSNNSKQSSGGSQSGNPFGGFFR